MKEIYFENVLNVGNLYIEKVFNEFEGENLIFICNDSRSNKYLCICYEMRYKLEWVLCKISTNTLCSLLKAKQDLYSAFEAATSPLIQIIFDGNETVSAFYTYEEFDKNLLPTKGVCLKPDNDEISYLLKLLYNKTCIKNLDENYNYCCDIILTNKGNSFNWNINLAENNENVSSEHAYSAVAA